MIDAMKQAWEELEEYCDHKESCRFIPYRKPSCICGYKEAVTALRQAIAEAEKEATLQEISDIGQDIEQEPVAWWNGQGYNFGADDEDFVYPETRQNHIKAGSHGYFWSIPLYTTPNMSTKQENVYTSAERVQEIDKSIHEEIERLKAEIKRAKELAEYRLQLLMKLPEQKEWVGLTDELKEGADAMFYCGAKWAEAKLKEKNT
jgi:hypothetical protein